MPHSAAKIKLVIILGPTASGKSDLALRLAQECGGEIVNADSMQLYQGMDIGTAKPSQEVRRMVPHHLLDIVDPAVNFTASDFRAKAARAIADIHARGKRVFVVGGTGLYIKALLQGLVDSPRGDETIRRELEAFAEKEGNDSLHRELSLADPVTAERLHPNDRFRIIRALEVFRMTGRPISESRGRHGFSSEYYDPLKVGVNMDRRELYERIDRRVDAMMASGFLEEVRGLLERGYGCELKAMRSIGYKELCAHLAGEYGLDEAVRLMKRDTRRYAKRQLTWFGSDPEINWFEYRANFVNIYNHVIEFYC